MGRGAGNQREFREKVIRSGKESWERFRDGTLMPRMQHGVQGEFAAPPQETAFEVYKQAP